MVLPKSVGGNTRVDADYDSDIHSGHDLAERMMRNGHVLEHGIVMTLRYAAVLLHRCENCKEPFLLVVAISSGPASSSILARWREKWENPSCTNSPIHGPIPRPEQVTYESLCLLFHMVWETCPYQTSRVRFLLKPVMLSLS